MTLNTNIFASLVRVISAACVGAVFLWTGLIKAVAPHTFRRHLDSLGWIPENLVRYSVSIAAALEAGWGAALVVGVLPQVVFPASILVLAVFSAITWWSVNTGKAADCGCYGGFIQPSVGQSIGLNLIFAILIIAAWVSRAPTIVNAWWQWSIPIAVALSVAAVAEWAQRYEFRTGTPKFTPSPLEEGAAWKHSWARNLTRNTEGEIIVAMLGLECPFCKQWVKVGNAMTQSPLLPTVFGVVGASEKLRDKFVAEHNIRFPVASISPSLMNRLAQAVPTTLLVEKGRIKQMWVGNMPPEFVHRFRKAFFPDDLIATMKAGSGVSAASGS
jgi:hypothetical protein